jgi:hypothetical protein
VISPVDTIAIRNGQRGFPPSLANAGKTPALLDAPATLPLPGSR